MKHLPMILIGAGALVLLQGCQKTNGPRKLDINGVMDRTIDAMVDFAKDSEASGVTLADNEVIPKFAPRLHAALNARPKVFTGNVGLTAKSDASFQGFDDLNKNNRKEDGEQHLFTLEIDAENERLIATDFSENTYGTQFRDGQYRGYFFVWVSRRQSAAGLRPNRFAGRNIDTRMKPVRAASSRGRAGRTRSARSRARSGGSRSGK
ncbi:MAG: hypothetical protein AAGJ73_02045 [Pseudomonadota bacterium]